PLSLVVTQVDVKPHGVVAKLLAGPMQGSDVAARDRIEEPASYEILRTHAKQSVDVATHRRDREVRIDGADRQLRRVTAKLPRDGTPRIIGCGRGLCKGQTTVTYLERPEPHGGHRRG